MHEMQHPVMGAAEAIFLQNRIGTAGEVAIGEEQELDAGHEVARREVVGPWVGRSAGGRLAAAGARHAAGRNAVGGYVSHVDLFGPRLLVMTSHFAQAVSAFARAKEARAMRAGAVWKYQQRRPPAVSSSSQTS